MTLYFLLLSWPVGRPSLILSFPDRVRFLLARSAFQLATSWGTLTRVALPLLSLTGQKTAFTTIRIQYYCLFFKPFIIIAQILLLHGGRSTLINKPANLVPMPPFTPVSLANCAFLYTLHRVRQLRHREYPVQAVVEIPGCYQNAINIFINFDKINTMCN